MKEFIEQDPFNPQNTVYGHIYGDKDGKDYGCLQILKINGKDAKQYIYATPKFEYPGSSFPTGWHDCTVYDKLDGTNILAYRYEFEGKTYTSFKTRLTPFLKDSGYSTWIKLWTLCMQRYPEIQEILDSYPWFNIAFEMYGSLNPIIVPYKTELDCKLIYGIDRNNGNLVQPKVFTDNLSPIIYKSFTNDVDPMDVYKQTRDELEVIYQKDKSVEGAMFYFSFSDKQVVYKCKPPSVKEEFAKANGYKSNKLGWNCVYTTAVNALENITSLEQLQDQTEELLLEEFSQEMIDINASFITKVVEKVKEELILRDRVKELYLMSGLKFPEQKGEVMRYLMQNFSKDKSTKVYHAMCYITM